MSLQVTGKNIEVGEAFQAYVGDKLDAAIEKYVGQHLSAHVRVAKERGKFHTSCSVRLRTGLMLEATGDGGDAYASADNAFERLEKRLRRYKRRLKSHHHHGDAAERQAVPEQIVTDYVLALAADEGADLPDDEITGLAPEPSPAHDLDGANSHNPLIIAETGRSLRELAVADAVMQLDLTDDAFLVFRNAGSGAINVVYRRVDGNIGWIDPSPRTGGDGAGRVAADGASTGS